MAIKTDKVLSPQEIAEAQKAWKRLTTYLDSQAYSPPNKKERERIVAAMLFDLDHMRKYLGQTVEQRLAIFERNSYLLDEMVLVYEGKTIYPKECT